MSRLLATLVLALALAAVVIAVDKSNFKRCDQSGFCHRLRSASASNFVVEPSSVVADPSLGVITATLKNMAAPRPVPTIIDANAAAAAVADGHDADLPEGGEAATLPAPPSSDIIDNNARELSLRLVLDGPIGRLQLREVTPLVERYNVADVLVTPFEFAAIPVTVGRSDNSIEMHSAVSAVRLTFSPFSVDWLDGSGKVLASANRRSGLAFEDTRTKPPPGSPELAYERSLNMWDESFKGAQDSKPRGPQGIALDLDLPTAASLYGIPEHAAAFALKNTRGPSAGFADPYRLYNLDVFEYELNSEAALYGSVPLLWGHSARGPTAGVFWLNAAETWIDLEDLPTGGRGSRWISETGNIDAFVLLGPTPAAALKQYARLTGPAFLPPLFSVAYHQCRWNYKDEDDVRAVDAAFDDADMPYDVIWLDIEHTDGKRYFTWDAQKFPTPTAMLDGIASKGRKMVAIVDPHLKRDNGYRVYAAARDAGLLIQNKDGGEYDGFCWPGGSAWLDVTSSPARDFWVSQFAYDKYTGSTPALFIWNDMNEMSQFSGPEITMHKDARHITGREHREVHNQYGSYFHGATAAGLIARDAAPRRPFVLTRAFFAGSQRTAAVWTGDNAAQWSHLEASIPMLLSHSVAGIPFIGADVGGFFGDPSPALLARWYQAGALQPFFRAHAHIDAKRREPWLFGEPTTSIIRDALRRRYRFLPLLYTAFEEASRTLTPVMAPLWFHNPTDAKTLEVENAFLVGNAVLSAPVLHEGATSVSVYLPAGRWFDIDTHQAYSGGAVVTIQAPADKSPALYRGGAIVPLKMRARRSSAAMAADPFTLVVALGPEGTADGSLYLDDGYSFAFQSEGAFAARRFTYKNNALRSTLDMYRPAARTAHRTSERIERVVLLGASDEIRALASVKLLVGGAERTLPLLAGEGGAMVVRNPDVGATEDWEIRFA